MAGKSYRRSVVAQDITDSGDEPALVRKVLHDKDWNTYRDKGQDYWGHFNRRDINQPDYDPCDLDGLYATPDQHVKVGTTLVGNLKQILNSLGVPTGPDYFQVFSFYPKNYLINLFGEFMNNYSPQDGVVVASVNARHQKGDTVPSREVPDEEKAPDNWSSVAWAQWKRGCITMTPGTSDFSNIRIIMRRNVDNGITSSFMVEALESVGKSDGQIAYFYLTDPDNKDSDNPFWPLLGSPNGNGMIHLLKDHKSVLGNRSITRIGVYFHENSGRLYNYLWAELTGANINQENYPLPP